MLTLNEFDSELLSLLNADRKTEGKQRPTSLRAHHPELGQAHLRFSGALKTHSVLCASMRQLVRIRLAVHKWCRICIAIRYADPLANNHPAIDTGFDEQLKVHFSKKALWELAAVGAICIGSGRLFPTSVMTEYLCDILNRCYKYMLEP